MPQDPIKQLISREVGSSRVTTVDRFEPKLDLSTFFNSFYYDNFHCLRYLWYHKSNSPKSFSSAAFDLYIRILGYLRVYGIDTRNWKQVRYNVFDTSRGYVCVESSIHKQELYRLIGVDRDAHIFWIEKQEWETVRLKESLPEIEIPTSLVSKVSIGVDLTYCNWCCYQVICL